MFCLVLATFNPCTINSLKYQSTKKTLNGLTNNKDSGSNCLNVSTVFLNFNSKSLESIKRFFTSSQTVINILLIKNKTNQSISLSYAQLVIYWQTTGNNYKYTESFHANLITKTTTNHKGMPIVTIVRKKVIFGFAWFAGKLDAEGIKMQTLTNILSNQAISLLSILKQKGFGTTYQTAFRTNY